MREPWIFMFSPRSWGRPYLQALALLLVLQMAFMLSWQPEVWAGPDLELLPGSVTLRDISYPIGPGTDYQIYHLRVGTSPQVIHVIRMPLHDPFLHLEVSLPQGQLRGRETVGSHAARSSSPDRTVIAAINGDFFWTEAGYNGVPTGITVRDGQLVRHPWGAAFGLLDDGSLIFGAPGWTGTVSVFEDDQLLAQHSLHGINSPRSSDQLILFTPAFGDSTGTNMWGKEVLMDILEISPSGDFLRGEVMPALAPGDNPILPSGAVLSGHSAAAAFLREHALPGRQVEVSWVLDDPWNRAVQALGGRPLLVKEGRLLPDGTDHAPLPNQAAPRSAVALTEDGFMLLVAVDGRQPGYSAGLTIPDFALLLKRLGAVEALNLDGGGSTTMLRRYPGEEEAKLANRPSDGRSRAVGNALLIMSSAPRLAANQLFIDPVPSPVLTGVSLPVSARALDIFANPAPMPTGQISWHLEGAQGEVKEGILTTTAPGRGRLIASLGGLRGETSIRVLDPGEIEVIEVLPSEIRLHPGEKVVLSVRLYDDRKRRVTAEAGLWVWEVDDGLGEITIDPAGRETFLASRQDRRGSIFLTLGDHRVKVPVTIGEPPPFSDIAGHWAAPAISELAHLGVVGGYGDGTFRPDREVTRAEFSKMVVQASGLAIPLDLWLPFEDDVPTWARPYVAAAVASGIIRGYPDNTFRPDATITRAEMAAMVARALDATAGGGEISLFEDEIPQWARGYVESVSQMGLIRGFPDGTFRPTESATRAQSSTVMWRMVIPRAGS